ncbi:MAG: SecY interacting protein Syd [Phenylobacterium sp.]|jgi:SecY interacting protein Syd
MLTTEQALDNLLAQWQSHYAQQAGGLPTVEHDPQWPSACEIEGSVANGQVQWQPVKRENSAADFANVEHALDIVLHQDIKTFFSYAYSGEFDLNHEKGPVTLLQVWNDEDFANLQQNLIGHIMMKRRLKQPVTLFFALTDQDEQIISLNNESGEVWLESVGKLPHLKLADCLAAFLGDLSI